jgi:hypothetical protein
MVIMTSNLELALSNNPHNTTVSRVRVMKFNATFNNMSVILVEEIGVEGES